jgi:16S rRNA (uracil1498-N3)-methyltransferase
VTGLIAPSATQGLQRLVIAPEQIHQQLLQLTSTQSHYLWRVLRLPLGGRFIALLQREGQGEWWLTELVTETQARLLELIPVQTELPVAVTLLAALPKGNGFDAVVTQATELGVAEILPVLSERTLLHPSTHKLERWQRLAKEAAEQSLRQVVPQIHAPLPLAEGLSKLATPNAQGFICVLDPTAPHLSQALRQGEASTRMTLVTGPEGGWTLAEQTFALSLGFQPVSLGARTLRAVTAPMVALALVAASLEGDVS